MSYDAEDSYVTGLLHEFGEDLDDLDIDYAQRGVVDRVLEMWEHLRGGEYLESIGESVESFFGDAAKSYLFKR